MCGIAGIIELNHSLSETAISEELTKMLAELRHRGPDGTGQKTFDIGGSKASFGHQRLSIIDLSHAADQPMMSMNGDLCIVFNGEIYNYIELRQKLANHYTFRTLSDTEVLLAAFIYWGEAMLEKLEGMFAFVIYNTKTGFFWGARDPFGIKPFYYTLSGNSFRFASEPAALWKTQIYKPEVNQTAVADFLLFGLTDHTERTFFSDIKQLRGGHVISGRAGHSGSISIKMWWKPEVVKIDSIPEQQVYDCIGKSVRIHLRSDVPVGGCLSGGLDSGSINHFAAKLMNQQGVFFNSITFSEKGFEDDESSLAAATASRTGTTQHLVSTTPKELEKELEQLTLAMGEPYNTLSMYAQFKVFQKAQKLGLKVMLDGQGGDEVFAGYPRVAALVFKDYLNKFRLLSAWEEMRGFQKNASLGIKEQLALNFFFTNSLLMERRAINRLDGLISEDLLRQFDSEVTHEYFGNKTFAQAQYMELTKYVIPRLLRYEDRNSMHFSIESRVPLLSSSVVNLGLSLPTETKVKQGWTKFALRKAMSGNLPEEVIWQKKKRGFDVPQNKWTNALNPHLITLLNESAPLNRYINISKLIQKLHLPSHPAHIWRTISLQLWLLKNGLSL